MASPITPYHSQLVTAVVPEGAAGFGNDD